jgi:hypothetical protein
MTAIGDFAKITLILFALSYIILMAVLAASGNTALSIVMLVGLMIPTLWLIYWHAQDKKHVLKS